MQDNRTTGESIRLAETKRMMHNLVMYGVAVSNPIPVNNPSFEYEVDETMVSKNTPGKLTFKVPMQNQVIDEFGRLFEYEIKDKKPVYTFLCAILPEH